MAPTRCPVNLGETRCPARAAPNSRNSSRGAAIFGETLAVAFGARVVLSRTGTMPLKLPTDQSTLARREEIVAML
ncbi:MAG: hypothetical protein WBZ51_25830, partial [Xanthobacteraceae bacterium]